MGIDIYMHWDDQTDDERRAQYTGFDTTAGSVGYLREAYHGDPYATDTLVFDAFEWTESINRLMSNAEANGSELDDDLVTLLARGVPMRAEALRERLPDTLEKAQERIDTVYPDTHADVAEQQLQAYTDFVELAERKQAEGKNVYVYASY
jgi:hypothetical protein